MINTVYFLMINYISKPYFIKLLSKILATLIKFSPDFSRYDVTFIIPIARHQI